MPIYEFKCENCNEVSAMTMKFSDPHPESCPQCNEGPVRKIISSTSFILKGGGWFTDAYSSKPSAASSTPSTASSTPSAASSEPSTAASPKASCSASSGSSSSHSCPHGEH